MKIQYIYILLLAVLFAILPIHAIAGNCQENSNDFMYIENINVEAGETFDIPVKFRNEATYSAFQCDMTLPEGVEFVTDEYGDYCITPESSRLTNTHTITISQTENGDMRVVCYSSASRDIRGNDGALFYIKAKAGEECRGELRLRMSNIRFSTADATEKILEDVECTIYVENIQGGGEEETTNDFMYIENINVEAGGTFDIPVKFRNEATYSAFQCDIKLPQGVEFVTDEYGDYCITPESSRLTGTHTITISQTENGDMRVVCYSSASRDIRGNDGALFYIKAKAGEECRGELRLRMSNIRFSTADATEKILEDVEGTITIIPPVKYYTITYMVGGEVYATDSIAYGAKIEPMQEPTKEGHTFSGWSDIPETMPANDVTVEGTFTVNYYTITYMVDGEVYATDSIAYGAKIEPMQEPTKEGHTFSGWSDIPETMPASDVTVEGTFTVNYYTVTFVVDGEVYQSISVKYGTEIELPAAPEKEGYIFTGWIDVPATMPAEDIVIEGKFEINTGIGITNFDLEKDEIYNLNGLRIINTEDITRGIYIINGKKVLVK